MNGRRKYSDEDKATALAALDANGGNVKRTATELEIPRITLLGWADGRGVHPVVSELQQEKRGALAERLEEIAHKIVDILPDKLQDATLQQCATSLGIIVDKRQLLMGKPTGIVDDASLTDLERANRVNTLLDIARARRDGQVVSTDSSRADN